MGEDEGMKPRTAARLAWVAFGFIALFMACGLALSALNARGRVADAGEILAEALLLLAMFSFPVVGVLIATRQPHNAIGWILLAIGFVWELPGESYVRYGFITDPGSVPRPDLVAVLMSSSWVPGIGLIGTFLILLFPNGKLPSPRWRPLAWLCAVVLIVLTIVIPLTPGPLREVSEIPYLPDVPNPLGLDALRQVLNAFYVLLPLLPLCILACAVSLIGRFRRSQGQERLQLKWLAAGAGVSAILYLLAMAFTLSLGAHWSGRETPVWLTLLQNLALYSFVLIPVAIGFAVLRYRLYDIDVIINRTLVYGVLTALLALTYSGIVVILQRALDPVTRRSDLAIAGSTLAVAALFRPLRARVQTFIDRRFYRHKYDAEQTLAEFSARLRDPLDLDSLNAELVGVVTRTMQPSRISLWLKPPAP